MENFIKNYVDKIVSSYMKVEVSTKKYKASEIQTTFGIKPFEGKTEKEGYLIFIDLCTIANWSHPCLYLFYISEEEIYEASEGWMPHESIKMQPFPILSQQGDD